MGLSIEMLVLIRFISLHFKISKQVEGAGAGRCKKNALVYIIKNKLLAWGHVFLGYESKTHTGTSISVP